MVILQQLLLDCHDLVAIWQKKGDDNQISKFQYTSTIVGLKQSDCFGMKVCPVYVGASPTHWPYLTPSTMSKPQLSRSLLATVLLAMFCKAGQE